MTLEQKIYPFDDHRLPINKIDSHALFVMEKLKAAGFIAYLVGGSVRDLLLNHRPKDFDISTSAKPEEIKQLFRNCILIGRRFRLAHVRFGQKIIEVSTFRSGDPQKEELILRDNQWGLPEEDALRRDFTINGLFYDPETQSIIDYVDGFEDLQKKVLRTIGQPFVRFKQDPVRMLRLLKFQARFGFTVDSDAHIALVECRHEIIKSSPARILEEFFRMLESGSAKTFVRLLNDHGFMYHMLPEIAHFFEKEEEGEDIYAFLQEIDTIFLDTKSPKLERSILLSAIVFPLLNKKLYVQFIDRGHFPHLGEIQNFTRNTLHDVFQGFFHVPRKIRMDMSLILSNQYRLTPFQKKRKSRFRRIPKDPDFLLAIEFLGLRSCLEPGLKEIYQEWMQTHQKNFSQESPQKMKNPKRIHP